MVAFLVGLGALVAALICAWLLGRLVFFIAREPVDDIMIHLMCIIVGFVAAFVLALAAAGIHDCGQTLIQ